MPSSVQLVDVSVAYPNGVKALTDVTVTIGEGEFVFLVGPTGHGKSTFLKLLYREEVPSSGHVLVSGWDVALLSPNRVAHLRRRVGVVFQDFRLLPQRTAWENIAFALHVTGTTYRTVTRTVPDVLAQVGLLEKADDFPAAMSAGEQQRLALARAIALRPPLILADEPTGNLDLATGREIIELLRILNKEQGVTVISATHDMKMLSVSDRVVWIRDGVIDRIEKREDLDISVGSIEGDEAGGVK